MIKLFGFGLTIEPHLVRWFLSEGRSIMSKLMTILLLGMLGVLLLVGCRAQATPTPTVTAISIQVSPVRSPGLPSTSTGAYPDINEPMGTVYPAPDDSTMTAYPAPTEASAAYPAPTEEIGAVYPNPTQPPSAYPGPIQPTRPIITALPATVAPGTNVATGTASSLPVSTNTPLPTFTPMPTVTLTPELPPPIRSELLSTNPDQFIIASGKVQLVEFFAFWSVACRSQADGISRLEALYGSRMNFIYLDIDDPANTKFKQALGFRYEPDFYLLDQEGNILSEWSGWVVPEEIRNAIEAALR